MSEFVRARMQYPTQAINAGVNGIVITKLDIDFTGNVRYVRIISGIGYGCDEEAMRLCRLLKFAVDQTPRKGKVIYQKTINIHFNLPKSIAPPKETHEEPISESIEINYLLTYENHNKQPKEPPSALSYTVILPDDV